MQFQNLEIYNAAELVNNPDGSISWRRVPKAVYDAMDSDQGRRQASGSTGVELRFVLKGESATIRMSNFSGSTEAFNSFHVYYGGIQGGWMDHEVNKYVGGTPTDFVIHRPEYPDRLKKMTEFSGYDWDSEVVRIIFDRGSYKLYGISGEVEPPKPCQTPRKTLLAYGSSITHGSNSIDMSHSWVSLLAHNLNMDARNLGMAGSCAMEPEMAEYIAAEGEQGKWDVAVLELGINVLAWEPEKIQCRVENILRQVAGRNPEKPVVVISPFYYCREDFEDCKHGQKWRTAISQIVEKLNYSNVTYCNGLELLPDMSGISADQVHPNIYGVQQIAQRLTERLQEILRR